MEEKPTHDFSTATIDQLIDALAERCDAIVIGMSLKVETHDEAPVRMRFRGDRLTGRGLIADMTDYAREPSHWEKSDFANVEEDKDEDDEGDGTGV